MSTTATQTHHCAEARPPQVHPDPEVLDVLELLRMGLYQPRQHGPIQVPAPLGASSIEIVDAEGVPIARISRSSGGHVDAGIVSPEQVSWLGHLSTRPFERLYTSPDVVGGGDLLTLVVDRKLTAADLTNLGPDRPLQFIIPTGPSTAPTAESLASVRSALAECDRRPGSRAITVPLSISQMTSQPELYVSVVSAYARNGVHRLPARPRQASLDQGHRPGVVLYFTGLSGSGKSTVARAVRNTLLERDGVPVSLLDGDVVRRNLSAGLGFSPEDRETNIRRIGWVAAEIAHHGGVVVCSPISPYDSTRKEVRSMVEDRGARLLLIHISTPLEECERRDRKGLYARARAGEVPNFTGISAPYEVPTDADLTIDTTHTSVDQARDQVLDLLIPLVSLPEASGHA